MDLRILISKETKSCQALFDSHLIQAEARRKREPADSPRQHPLVPADRLTGKTSHQDQVMLSRGYQYAWTCHGQCLQNAGWHRFVSGSGQPRVSSSKQRQRNRIRLDETPFDHVLGLPATKESQSLLGMFSIIQPSWPRLSFRTCSILWASLGFSS